MEKYAHLFEYIIGRIFARITKNDFYKCDICILDLTCRNMRLPTTQSSVIEKVKQTSINKGWSRPG